MAFLLPVTVGFMMLSEEITEAFFERGAFDQSAVVLTATALSFYAIGIVFAGIRELLARYYYAYGNTEIPMLNAAIVTVVLMWHQCEKLSEHAKIALQWEEIGEIVLTSIFMGAIVVFVKQSVHVTGLLQLFFLVFVGMVSYGIMLLIFRVEIANELLYKIKARIRGNTDE